MRLVILAGGGRSTGPEAALAETYLARAAALAPRLGFGVPELVAVSEKDLAAGRLDRLPAGAVAIALDEAGDDLTSAAFAARLTRWRDAGTPGLGFLIGGADGLPRAWQSAAGARLALGRATWPHLLVRALISEQIYRAMTIIAGHPYHRG